MTHSTKGRRLLLTAMLLDATMRSCPLPAADLLENATLGLRHPTGFQITRFATREQAPDIQALTLDTQGRVVVSGRGWIRRLEDTDANGSADRVVEFAAPSTGARGMVFMGNDLYCLADGFFGRFLDSDGNGVADGAAQRFFEFGFGPTGVQNLRLGPDGAWYVLAGPNAGLGPAHWNYPNSPIRNPESGALLHISRDLSRSEVVAEGFLHAADFDFLPTGDILAYDQGYARDAFLPWMALPRLFHVAHGAHHGWRGLEEGRPRTLPEYDPTQVPVLWSANASAPAGMTFYRHHQFPKDYRGGLLVADWENGRILLVRVQPFQSGYTAAVQVFIEASGRHGFTPQSLAVGVDGSLYIATGGQGTGDGVFQVKFTELDPKTGKLPDQPPPFLSTLDAVLRAPQRTEAWSRAQWVPLALREGRRAFQEVAMSVGDPEEFKLVALDVLTELHGGITRWEANVTSKSGFTAVRAKTAWCIARNPFDGSIPILEELCRDESPVVRRAALEVFADNARDIPAAVLLRVASTNLDQDDLRTREAAIALATRLPDAQWQQLLKQATKQAPLHRLAVTRARLQRQPVRQQPNEAALSEALAVLREPEKGTPLLGLLALKLVGESFGGPNARSGVEAFAGYELRLKAADHPALAAEVLSAIRPLFPAGHPIVDAELARALAWFEDPDPATPNRMLGAFGAQSSAASDLHYLACLANLNPAVPAPGLTNLAEVFLWLDNKIGEPGNRPGLNWRSRVLEMASRLATRHPEMAAALVRHPGFAEPEHAWLATMLSTEQRTLAHQRFLAASTNPAFRWNTEVIQLLGEKPSAELSQRLRAQWARIDLHDAIVQALARQPEAADYEKFTAALVSADPRTTSAALNALVELPETNSVATLPAVIKALHRAVARPEQGATRKGALAWLNKHGGWTGKVDESSTDRRSLEPIYRPVFNWFNEAHPKPAAELAGMTGDELAHWETQLKEAPWVVGKAARGAELFLEHRCAQCHAGGGGFGSDLRGFARQLSPADAMRTILYPHLEVAPGTGVVELFLRNGERLSGVVVFESLDTLLLRQEEGETLRLAQAAIAHRRQTNDSFMPVGLLKGVSARGLADLHAYLETLR